jgi:hypothetical protein
MQYKLLAKQKHFWIDMCLSCEQIVEGINRSK